MREDWLTRQLEALEEHVKAERRRRKDEIQQQALRALIALSLPELLGEISDQQDAPPCEPASPSVH